MTWGEELTPRVRTRVIRPPSRGQVFLFFVVFAAACAALFAVVTWLILRGLHLA